MFLTEDELITLSDAGHIPLEQVRFVVNLVSQMFEEKMISKLQAKLKLAGEALGIVDYTNRSRGYPMPKEWEEVVRICNTALAELRKA